jgi:hypothetical protein
MPPPNREARQIAVAARLQEDQRHHQIERQLVAQRQIGSLVADAEHLRKPHADDAHGKATNCWAQPCRRGHHARHIVGADQRVLEQHRHQRADQAKQRERQETQRTR